MGQKQQGLAQMQTLKTERGSFSDFIFQSRQGSKPAYQSKKVKGTQAEMQNKQGPENNKAKQNGKKTRHK